MSNGIYPVLPVGAYPANTQAIANAHLQNNQIAKNNFESGQTPAAPQPDKLQAALAGNPATIPVQKIQATDPQIPKQNGNPKDPTGQTGQKLYCLA